jgi:hypothetical protein
MNNGISYKTTLKNRKMDLWLEEEQENSEKAPDNP